MSRELGQETQRYLVIPDLHGEIELGKRAVDLANTLDAEAVFLGDLIGRGGPAVKETVELARAEGTAVLGNHELLFLNALEAMKAGTEINPKAMKSIREMLANYGADQASELEGTAENLKQAMDEEGHLAWMRELEPFFETDGFIALHAGPRLDKPWRKQRKDIRKRSQPSTDVSAGPIQITDAGHELSGAIDVPQTVDERIFVTGHWHKGDPASERTAERRVYLTSRLGKDPLFVWDSEKGEIHEIPARGNAQMSVPTDLPQAA